MARTVAFSGRGRRPRRARSSRSRPACLWLRMRLPFALDHINLWLIEDGPGWTAVDTGFSLPETQERVAAHLCRASAADGRSRRVIVTHFHPDHIGMAGWLTEHWQAPLVDHRQGMAARPHEHDRAARTPRCSAATSPAAPGSTTRPAGSSPSARAITAAACRRCRRPTAASPRASVIEIGGRDWRVLIGEGHAPEHACLFCEETGVLIAGDQILPRISPNISVQAYEPDGDPLARYLASLTKLRGAVAARHPGTAVAQSAVPRRASAHRRAGGASPTSAATRCSPPATAR